MASLARSVLNKRPLASSSVKSFTLPVKKKASAKRREVDPRYQRQASHPSWLWFLSRDFGSIGLLLALLIRVDITREGGGIRTRFVSEKEQKQVLFDLFSRGNALFRAYDLPVEECDQSADSALASIYRQ